MAKDIFELITQEESAYAIPIPVTEGYEWNMKEHIRLTVLYKNSQFAHGNSQKERDNKPFKNIMRPILNFQYRTEGFDVKDIELFINDEKQYYKSFLVRKFHEKWARMEHLDTFLDELVESYVDFGGTLIKDVNSPCPEVVALQTIAFCDQTDMLGGPIGIGHFFSPDTLMDMEAKGWGSTEKGATISIEDLITLAKNEKTSSTPGQTAKTPGKQIKLYEVHGNFPNSWLPDQPDDAKGFSRQMHIVGFYQKEGEQKEGVWLFRGKAKRSFFKVLLRDKIFGRALGFGGAEELFEPQVWTNYGEIRMKEMLDAAAKIIYKTTDQAFKTRNKTKNAEQGEILVVEDGKDIGRLDNTLPNITAFERSVAAFELHAKEMGSANEVSLGAQPASGIPFKLQDLVTAESHGLHEYRQGKISSFVAQEVYPDWVLPYLNKEITKGQKFLSELSLDELQQIADNLVTCEANKYIKEQILSGKAILDANVEELKVRVRDDFMRGGPKRFLEILAGEMENVPTDVWVNIAGKQKNMALMTDKLVNVFRIIISNPAVLQDPVMAKLFNQIIEYSGLSPMDFMAYRPQPQVAEKTAIPTKEVATA